MRGLKGICFAKKIQFETNRVSTSFKSSVISFQFREGCQELGIRDTGTGGQFTEWGDGYAVVNVHEGSLGSGEVRAAQF